jgi:hypothetical protein
MSRQAIFGLGLTAKTPNVSGQRRLNLYLDIRPEGDKSRVIAYGTPGLSTFVDFGDTPTRGGHSLGNFSYIVHRGVFWEVNNAGVKTSKGMLSTNSGRVYFADNGVQICLTDGAYRYVYYPNVTAKTISTITNSTTTATLTTATAHGLLSGMTVVVSGATHAAYNGTFVITVTTDIAFTYTMLSNPGGSASVVGVYTVSTFQQLTLTNSVSSIAWMDQYFIGDRVNSGRFEISNIGNPYLWDVLDFANAEGSPDNLVRMFVDHGELLPFGDLTMEFWGDSGALDFPFARLGSAIIEWGLAARDSLTKFDSSIMFLGKNRMGKFQVVLLDGYTPTPVGDTDFITAIEQYATVTDATAYSYMNDAHPFYQINFPTANKSWLYDGKTKAWSELQSDTGRHRGNLAVLYIASVLVGDYSNGKVYRLDQNVYTDNGMMIPREIVSRPLLFGENYTPINRLWVDMETGVGLTTGQGSNPQVMLSVSKNGGHGFGSERWRSAGKIGEYQSRVYWNRLGSVKPGNAWCFKLRITDPVKVAIMNEGWIDTDGN